VLALRCFLRGPGVPKDGAARAFFLRIKVEDTSALAPEIVSEQNYGNRQQGGPDET